MSHAVVRTTERLWGLRWEEHLPWELGDGLAIEAGSFDDAMAFVAQHYAAIFRTGDLGSRAFAEEMSSAKERFLREADVFLVRHGRRTIGVFLAHPTDWSTYYHRSAALLPEYQARGLIEEVSVRTEPLLREAGCVRIEADTAASNTPMIRALARLGYNVVSTSLSDRWGATIRFCRLLSEEAQGAFADQFCCGVRHARPGAGSRGATKGGAHEEVRNLDGLKPRLGTGQPPVPSRAPLAGAAR